VCTGYSPLAVENLSTRFRIYLRAEITRAEMALLHNIPLVSTGENGAEYGNPIADTRSAKRDWSYFARNKAKIILAARQSRTWRAISASTRTNCSILAASDEIERQKVQVHTPGYY